MCELSIELEVWEYGTGQELEKSIDALLEISGRCGEQEVGIIKYLAQSMRPGNALQSPPACNRARVV